MNSSIFCNCLTISSSLIQLFLAVQLIIHLHFPSPSQTNPSLASSNCTVDFLPSFSGLLFSLRNSSNSVCAAHCAFNQLRSLSMQFPCACLVTLAEYSSGTDLVQTFVDGDRFCEKLFHPYLTCHPNLFLLRLPSLSFRTLIGPTLTGRYFDETAAVNTTRNRDRDTKHTNEGNNRALSQKSIFCAPSSIHLVCSDISIILACAWCLTTHTLLFARWSFHKTSFPNHPSFAGGVLRVHASPHCKHLSLLTQSMCCCLFLRQSSTNYPRKR